MDDLFLGFIAVLIKEYGPGSIPWLCLIVVTGTFGWIISWVLRRLFAQQDLLIMLLREGAQADRDMAVEYRRLVDTILAGGLGGRRR